MTNQGHGPTRNERREHARELARITREAEQKRKRRRRWITQGSIVAAVLGIATVVVLVIANGTGPAASTAGPKNMLSDGIVVADEGSELAAVTTAALKPDAKPVATETTDAPGVAQIVVYLDYLCPFCGQFETTNAAQISTWVKSGTATLETHPISILDRLSSGSNFSTRAANAAACVANYTPDSFLAFNAALFAQQPAENTTGLSNDELASIAETAGATDKGVAACVTDETFAPWVETATQRALDGPLPNSDIEKLASTPTVIVNGITYKGSPDDSEAFAAFVNEQTTPVDAG